MATGEAVDLVSPLPPEAIAYKLQAIMADPMEDAKARVFGSGDQYRMRLRYARRGVQNAMALQLDASMEPRGGGTRITGTFGRSLAGRIFPYAWYGFLSIFVIIGVLVTSLVPDALLFGAIFAGVPLFMMVVGGAAMKAGQSRDEEDRREIMRFVTQELQTRPMA